MSGRLREQFMDLLEQWIGEGPKKFDLLYCFTRDGCDATAFHQKCDNQGPTVTVLYNHHGNIYGAYTAVNWKNPSGEYARDSNAFLFQLQNKNNTEAMKFPCKNPEQAVIHNGTCGPIFGTGYDLYTFSGNIKQTGDYYPLNGNMAGWNTVFDSQGIASAHVNNGTMNVTELEVYKVTDGKRTTDKPKPSASAKPWRKTPEWDIEFLECLKSEVEHFTSPSEDKVPESRILLIGPVGAGKSSFINTISSIFKGRIRFQAPCGSAEHSLTSKYRMYQVKNPTSGQPMKFRLCDTRGLEDGQGICANDISYLLDGNLPDGFQFNPSVPMCPEIPGFKKKTTLRDKVHCVCIVIDGSTGGVLPDKMLEKIKSIQTQINVRGIPQMVLLTKVDKLCLNVDADISQVFKSPAILEQVKKVSQLLGLPENQVLPTKNFIKETYLEENVSILALLTIRQILSASDDYMEHILDDAHCDSDEVSVLTPD